ELAGARDAVAAAAHAAAGVPGARAEVDRATEVVADVRRRDALDREEALVRVEVVTARERRVEARERHHELREARLESAATEFASMLVDGDPCLVCGATEHPEPAAFPRSTVTRADEDAAAAEVDRLGAELEVLEARHAGIAARLADLRTRTGAVTLAEATAALADARAESERLAQQADGLDRFRGEVVELERRVDVVTSAREAGRHASAQHRDRVAERVRSIAAETAQLVTAGVADADVAGAVAQVRARVRRLQALQELVDRERHAAEGVTAAEAEVEARSAGAGFPSAAAGQAAARSARWRAEALTRAQAHAAEVLAVDSALADPDLDVPSTPAIDLEAVAETVRVAEQTWSRAADDHRRAVDLAERLARLLPRLEQAQAALEPAREAARLARDLADLAGGTSVANALRMSLSAYVLAARLEEVAAIASLRLQAMTSGRYELVHTDAVGRGRGRSGLRMVVRDAWTGQDRDTATLSGGETFLASLALALGLADAVTAEAGAAPVDTLFVDEGFGSLDEDTLDEVMDVLDGLREGGRLVGLVSHVAELRSRVPAQLVVRKGRHGSSVAA
ncbi:SbcC/MukB-like Walker B domain-containing protein, partial [Jatrophihabitans sp. YIM 134969]